MAEAATAAPAVAEVEPAAPEAAAPAVAEVEPAAPAAAAVGRKIILRSSDGETFEVDEAVAKQSQTILHMMEDIQGGVEGTAIPLPNVDAATLARVIEYCVKHVGDLAGKAKDDPYDDDDEPKGPSEELKKWDDEFLKVDQKTLFSVILAANYLDIKALLDLTCKNVAEMMKDKPVEEIRKHFHIKNDYTPEEEEEVKRENSWAFE